MSEGWENRGLGPDTTVVVTGAGRGLGASLARAFASAGARLVLCGRNERALAEVAEAARTRGSPTVLQVPLDLTDGASIEGAIEQISSRLGRVDILINNAAMWLEGRSEPYTHGEVASVVATAVSGTFLMVQGLLPLLRACERPDVVTIGSVSALPNAALHTVSVPFYAAKHAQAALADGFRQQFVGTPIRSICIHPPWLEETPPEHEGTQPSERRRKGEMVTNQDVVEAVLFAVTRPRNVTIASMVIDSDKQGIDPGSH